jgi:hypothetical protein
MVAPGAAGKIREDSIRESGTTYAPIDGRDRLTRLLLLLLEKARAIRDPFEQSFFLLAHISYLQAFIDVNKRTARLASIIPLIRDDYVPQSFVEVDPDSYLKATIAVYELNEVRPNACSIPRVRIEPIAIAHWAICVPYSTPHSDFFRPAASKIKSAISLGCDTSDT